MKKRRLPVVSVAVAAFAIVWLGWRGCDLWGPASPLAPYLGPGERLVYQLQTSMAGGTAELRLLPAEQLDGRTVHRAVASLQPDAKVAALVHLVSRLESYIDPELGAPWKYVEHTETGAKYRVDWIDIDQAAHRSVHSRTKRYTDKQTGEPKLFTYVRAETDVPDQVQDKLSSLYHLRGRELREGETISIPVTDDRKVGVLRVVVIGPETLHLAHLGQIDAVKVELSGDPAMGSEGLFGSNRDDKVEMWLDAATRALLKVRIGAKLSAELVRVDNTTRPELEALGRL